MDKQVQQKVEKFEKLLDRTCPACAAKLENDLPYCASCGVGLPKFPRPVSLIVGSTVLFFLVGFPAGLIALYGFAYFVFGEWSELWPLVVSAIIFWVLLQLMLGMNEGTRTFRFGAGKK